MSNAWAVVLIVILMVACQFVWTLVIRTSPALLLKNLEHRNATELEKVRDRLTRDTQREIEKLRADLDAELDHFKDRSVRSNEREYQAVTEVWESFVTAFYATRACVAQFRSFPDLNKMAEDEVSEFLSDTGITGRRAARIVGSDDRIAAFSFSQRSQLINVAGDEVYKAIVLLHKQSVFIPDALAKQFEHILNDLNDARLEQFMVHRAPVLGPLKLDRSMALVGGEGTQLFEQMRDAVRDRLLRSLQPQQTI